MSTPSRLPMFAALLAAALLPWGCNCGGGNTDPDGGRDGDTPAVCGDGVREDAEACDDGDNLSGDGCSPTCAVEQGWSCPDDGGTCIQLSVCGNSVLETGESCDDGDAEPDDGCSATCQLESGWSCVTPGAHCTATRCGDGLIAGLEDCDDGDDESNDGCSDTCRLEDGFKCPTPGAACEPTVCGDGNPEGTEQCDDGNNDLGDGCTPLCTREPQCTNGICTAVCGDGVILPGDTTEACDDGNGRNGDGCSNTCTLEPGFQCELITDDPPDTMEIPVVYRDFRGWDLDPRGHEDFQNKTGGLETGLIENTLDADGKPVFRRVGDEDNLTTAENFRQWYRDVEGVNLPIIDTMVLNRQANGSYLFDDQFFFPIDDRGFVALGQEPLRDDNDADSVADRNFNFTSEVRYWFEYKGTEVLSFRGDDDVWVFINGQLTVDLGGLHAAQSGSVTLSNEATRLGLEVGRIYEAVVFQAERRTTASSYRLTLNNFTTARTRCVSLCGNGAIDPGEECDDGNASNDDTCTNNCRLACQALAESCSPTQECCGGLVCVNASDRGSVCDGTTSCVCDPAVGLRPR